MTSEDRDLTYPGGRTRLFVTETLRAGATVELTDGAAHYLLNVMRAKEGEGVRLFNGQDGEWRCVITQRGKRRLTLSVEICTRPQAFGPDLWLLFAPVKRAPIDYLIEKATELGIARAIPVTTRRTIVARVNTDRLRDHAREAAEQSGRLDVPQIAEPERLEALLSSWDGTRRILHADESGTAPPASTALKAAGPGPWSVLIGPEGGFDPAEQERLRTHSFVISASLGPRIMRADTAALAALSIWQSTLGDWR